MKLQGTLRQVYSSKYNNTNPKFYNFCKELATKKISKKEQKLYRETIKQNVIKKATYTGQPIVRSNFRTLLTPKLLMFMLGEYDKYFFDNKLFKLIKQNGCTISICFQNVCTGIRNTKGVAGYCRFDNRNKCYSITLSADLFERDIKTDSTIRNNHGVLCKGIFECIMITFEHEVIHALIRCFCLEAGTKNSGPGSWRGESSPSSGHSKTFMSIVNNLFGQTEYRHRLNADVPNPKYYKSLDYKEINSIKSYLKKLKKNSIFVKVDFYYDYEVKNETKYILLRGTIKDVYAKGLAINGYISAHAHAHTQLGLKPGGYIFKGVEYGQLNTIESIPIDSILKNKKISTNVKKKECPPGKVLNPKTNRCNKIKQTKKTSAPIVKPIPPTYNQIVKKKECPPGKVLNPKTNRCNKIKTKKKNVMVGKPIPPTYNQIVKKKECPPGKVLNPKTNRCNKIKTKKKNVMVGKPIPPTYNQIVKKKECPPGKVLNPKTNRCVNFKIKKTNNKKPLPPYNKIVPPNKKECPPGKVLNPKTNRCVNFKIKNQN